MVPGNCGDFGCLVGYPVCERAERECGPSPEVNPGNGVLSEKAVFGRKWDQDLVNYGTNISFTISMRFYDGSSLK